MTSDRPGSRRLAAGLPSAIAVLLLGATFGCAGPPALTSELELEANPSGRVPLGALLRFTTDRPAQVRLTLDTGDTRDEVTPTAGFATEHEVMVLGARPDRTNVVEVTLVGEDGQETAAGAVDFATPPLPDVFPPIEVLTSRPARMEPGVTLVPFFRWEGSNPEPVDDWGLIVALDAHGEVVWYYQSEHEVGEPLPISTGNLLYQSTTAGLMYEVDMLGRVQRTWHTRYAPEEKRQPGSIPITAGDTLHHDVLEMPSGNFLAVSTEVRQMDWADSPAPDAEVKERNVIGDVLIEFRPDGEVVRSWQLFDILDTDRRGMFAYDTEFYK
ncbi:MAG: aryl-sulfate sulfotransferase, partial [Thermoanaerobaculia bacterium]|nr:aryl-sulfate sulfotransferase [Thermoanaerobaculia bacterium]